MGLVKIILFVSNLIFVIAGGALFFLGLAIKLKLSPIKDIDGIEVWAFPALAVLVMAVGAIVFFIAFLGCYGAIKEIICMLTTYSIFMFILTAMSLAVAIPIFIKQSEVTRLIIEGLNKVGQQNDTLLHPVEYSLKCCGLNGPHFYEKRTFNTSVLVADNNTWGYYKLLPPSCCGSQIKIEPNSTTKTATNICNIDIAYSIGCANLIEENLPLYAIAGGLVLCVVACLEMLAALLSLYLKKDSEHAKY